MSSSSKGPLDSGKHRPKDGAMAKPMNPKLPVVVGATLAVLVLLGALGGGIYLIIREYRQVYVYRSVEGKVLASELSTRQIQSAKLRPAAYTPAASPASTQRRDGLSNPTAETTATSTHRMMQA